MTFDVKRAKEDGKVIYNGESCTYVGLMPAEYCVLGRCLVVFYRNGCAEFESASSKQLENITKKEKVAPYRRYYWRNGDIVEIDCVIKRSFDDYTTWQKELQELEARSYFLQWKDFDWVEEEIEV